ncbi:substrate-binding periplasmic protein [Pseudomonas akapageensis]|uniref:substrate-binding periplasmic protein n=1 Tax=Pseudomonas akapageensis TaxID=2609961 RepID=UPI00140B3A77|nr:transporter substrate-binding domain-containing protein [Pseudomonas akapageensis]
MRLALGALALLTCHCVAAEPALRFSIPESWTMPLARVELGQPVEGIVFDITQSLARQIGYPAEYHVMARLRLQKAMEKGDVDVRCYATRSWLPETSARYVLSLPLIYQRDVLIGSRRTATPIAPEQLPRQSIGTVLGYSYPTLQPLFDSNRLHREDARSQQQVLQKLQAGRFDYAVSNQLSLDWFNRRLPPEQQLHSLAVLEEQELGCYVRDDPSIPVERILQTLQNMKMSGEIDRIIERYRQQGSSSGQEAIPSAG